MSDTRRVHVTIIDVDRSHIEIVRYERAGKWFWECGGKRRELTVDQAVAFAQDRPAVIWYEGLPGGSLFDKRVRWRREQMQKEKR